MHFFPKHGAEWCALITGVKRDGSITLIVFPPNAMPLPIDNVRFCANERRTGCCDWPPRVGAA